MISQTGKRVLTKREMYSGRRRKTRRRTAVKERDSTMGIKLIISASLLAISILLKIFFPAGSDMIYTNLTSGLDYKSAFGALGRAIVNGENITEVFRGISIGGFNTEASESGSDILTEKDKDDTAEVFSPIYKKPEDLQEGMGGVDDTVKTADEEYFEELLLRLPTEELDDGTRSNEKDPPDTVSYDYYVIEFDYTAPLKGTVTSGFGYRNHPISGNYTFHYGLDIGAAKGTDIVSFASGTVELTGYNSIYGNYIFIRHKDGIRTFYGHCNKLLVEKGQLVLMGEAVAQVGSTGYSTGPHLHFEVRNGDIILNPALYISPQA